MESVILPIWPAAIILVCLVFWKLHFSSEEKPKIKIVELKNGEKEITFKI